MHRMLYADQFTPFPGDLCPCHTLVFSTSE